MKNKKREYKKWEKNIYFRQLETQTRLIIYMMVQFFIYEDIMNKMLYICIYPKKWQRTIKKIIDM